MNTALRPMQVAELPLSELTAAVARLEPGEEASINGISLDSRAIEAGWLYVALPGSRVHGAVFADQAIAAGAAAILTDVEGGRLLTASSVPVAIANNVREAMAVVAARLFGEPANGLTMFGVTGTNGKTTTVALLQAALTEHHRLAGTIGTIGFRLGPDELPSARSTVTTPESPDLQALLAVMREQGAEAVALEVSSHALALDRVAGIEFDVAAFLNLGHDHLDFHRTDEEYFEAKAKLFEPGRCLVSVIWIDDVRGQELAQRVRSSGSSRLVTVGTTTAADYQLSSYESRTIFTGSAVVQHADSQFRLALGLPGRYNMIDAVVALAMLESVGVPRAAILAGLAKAQVPGRMQRVDLGPAAPTVIVDFAHTPQAVGAALDSLAEAGEIITVVGCGGDRDPQKRPQMGRAAAQGSKLTIITDDNPRSEDPAAIRAQALAGARGVPGAAVLEIAGRRAAIREALARATAGQVVAILGKGHERGQILADRTVDFDDVAEVTLAWRQLKTGAADAHSNLG